MKVEHIYIWLQIKHIENEAIQFTKPLDISIYE